VANTTALIVGGAGLVGSATARALLAESGLDVVVVDRLGPASARKWANVPAGVSDFVAPENLEPWLNKNWRDLAAIICTADAPDPDDADAVFAAHFTLPKLLWGWAVAKQRGFVFASSSEVYGDGACLDLTDLAAIGALKPLSARGQAQKLFEMQVVRASQTGNAPPFWTGFRVFDAYGLEEAHKGARASVPYRAVEAAKADVALSVARSWSPAMADGHHKGDFIAASDVGALIAQAVMGGKTNGILNAGTGVATPYSDIARAAFAAVGRQTQMRFTEPSVAEIATMQRHVCADVRALRAAGFERAFMPLEAGIAAMTTKP
jgi:nucleoside-diphosphate-sugar epimerase